jgi:hypothetical protein
MNRAVSSVFRATTALLLGGLSIPAVTAATLTGSFASIPRNAEVNLSTAGPVDWVHWGLFTETSLNRKSGVTPRISDFDTVRGPNSNAFVSAYQYADNYNGYSWSDGTPVLAVTNTTTGVWAYGIPTFGTGFEFTVPADTTTRMLKVYVGAFAARGAMQVSLSDNSAGTYSDSSLANLMGNGPSGAYTITYAAASPGQTLRVHWTLMLGFRPDANVTLQAAALSSTGANNPPAVALTSPSDNANFSAPASITLEASASDFDGSIRRVEFYANDQKVGEDTTSPYSTEWNGVTPGIHTLKALAYDNGGEVSESMPVEIFVNGAGGSLVGSVAFPPSTVNLTTEGTADWTHWGLETNSLFDRKATGTPQLGDFTTIGDNPVRRYADNFTGYSWTDGTPTASANSSHTGVFIIGQNQGFALTLPADATPRTVRVYCGLYGAQGNFQAWLGDFSAPAYTDESLGGVLDNDYGVYTLTYTAASAGKTLNIRYRAKQLYDGDFGNVTLQSVTLVGGSGVPNTPPVVMLTSPTNNAQFPAPARITLQAAASDDGGVAKVEFFQGTTRLGEDTSSPYGFTWNNVPPGAYHLTARATDNFGITATSPPVTITVGSSPAATTLLNPRWAGTNFAFSFASQIGANYAVQFTPSLAPTNWQVFTNVAGNGSELSVTNRSPGGGQRFYRIESK